MGTQKYIFLLSDATGETIERMCTAALTQFQDKSVTTRRIANVRSKSHLLDILDEASRLNALVVYTMVNNELAQVAHNECTSRAIPSLDLMTPLLLRMSRYLGLAPQQMPGLLHGVDDAYYKRIEAVEFTVKHDDGQETRNLHKADIVLVCVSRTSTPATFWSPSTSITTLFQRNSIFGLANARSCMIFEPRSSLRR